MRLNTEGRTVIDSKSIYMYVCLSSYINTVYNISLSGASVDKQKANKAALHCVRAQQVQTDRNRLILFVFLLFIPEPPPTNASLVFLSPGACSPKQKNLKFIKE